MGKLEYLDALKRAMLGLAPEQQARTLAWYEQRFVDGVNAGRSEDDIARELDDPKKVALTLRASTHMDAFAAQKNPANLLRLLVSLLGLAIFNLFMVIPAAVAGALLASLYAATLACYLAGIVVTASALAGVNEMVLDRGWPHVVTSGADHGRTRISITEFGIEVTQDDAPGVATPGAAAPGVGTPVAGSPAAGPVIEIFNEADPDSRATQTMLGVAMILAGIVLCLLAVVVTRYAALGVKRYLQMNMSLLRG